MLSDSDNAGRRSCGSGMTVIRSSCLGILVRSGGRVAGADGRQGVCWLWDCADLNGRLVDDIDGGSREGIVYGNRGGSRCQEDSADTGSASIRVPVVKA